MINVRASLRGENAQSVSWFLSSNTQTHKMVNLTKSDFYFSKSFSLPLGRMVAEGGSMK